MKTTTHKNIKKMYRYKSLLAVFFATPIIVLFWQENGLSMTEIMLLQSMFSLFVVLLEVPTGYFSDIVGRKKTLALGALITGIGMIIYGFSHKFGGFLFAELAFGLGISFISGTDSAMVYDTLLSEKKEGSYKKIRGNMLFYSLIVMAVATTLGSIIGKIDFTLTFFLSIPFFIVATAVAFSMQEPNTHKNTILGKHYFAHLRDGIREQVLKRRKVLWLLIYAAVAFGFMQSALWFYQPYFSLTGVDILYFGIIFSAFHVVSGLSGKYAHKIEKYLGMKMSLISLVLFVGISLILMSKILFIFSFVFAFFQQFVRGYSKVVISDYINKLIDSSMRATILSIQSLFGKLFYASIIPFLGWVADVYTLTDALLISGISTLVLGGTVLGILKYKKVI